MRVKVSNLSTSALERSEGAAGCVPKPTTKTPALLFLFNHNWKEEDPPFSSEVKIEPWTASQTFNPIVQVPISERYL